jgi:hypothetical protein
MISIISGKSIPMSSSSKILGISLFKGLQKAKRTISTSHEQGSGLAVTPRKTRQAEP